MVTDQPGRIFAVVVLAPLLFIMGLLLNDGRHCQNVGRVLVLIAVAFFAYECFWLTAPARTTCF